ncbi:MAG: transcriptional regulator [Tardiphaga sp.]|nr:transcriptional regulator [Tardiphaga sp.]
MPVLTSAASLSRFPVVDTHDPEVMRDTLFAYYGATKFDVPDTSNFLGQSYHAKLETVSLGLCAYGTGVSVEFPESNFVRLQIAIAGNAATIINGSTTEICGSQACVTPADRVNRIEFGPDFKQLFLRIDKDALERKLAALLGAHPRRSLDFLSPLPDRQEYFESFKNLISFTAKQLDSTREHPPALMLKELEQALIVGFLETSHHSYRELLHRQPADLSSFQVRRVEDYIDDHWNLPLAVEDLAYMTGIGSRSIFSAFKRARGYTPIAYLKAVRLRNAKNLLSFPDTNTSVTGVAFQCGFSNPGHFAKDYQRTFGELPSVTLAKAKH